MAARAIDRLGGVHGGILDPCRGDRGALTIGDGRACDTIAVCEQTVAGRGPGNDSWDEAAA